MFKRVTAVVLFVQDFQSTLIFYRDILGLEVAQLEDGFVAFKMQDQDFAINEISKASAMVSGF